LFLSSLEPDCKVLWRVPLFLDTNATRTPASVTVRVGKQPDPVPTCM
jgi:hypothetical protein